MQSPQLFSRSAAQASGVYHHFAVLSIFPGTGHSQQVEASGHKSLGLVSDAHLDVGDSGKGFGLYDFGEQIEVSVAQRVSALRAAGRVRTGVPR